MNFTNKNTRFKIVDVLEKIGKLKVDSLINPAPLKHIPYTSLHNLTNVHYKKTIAAAFVTSHNIYKYVYFYSLSLFTLVDSLLLRATNTELIM